MIATTSTRGSALRTEYRADIDGLRAVAVLSVLAFHGFPTKVRGGFIGVDIFFVISGFLISSIIFNALNAQRFSYVEFYMRRIRRIFPALLAVLVACLIAGWFLLLPDEYKDLGAQVAAGAGFAANLLFWSQGGYFATDAAVTPLLHLWSLGIEEQFYLLWPLLLALLYRWARGHLPLILSMLLLASLAINVLSVYPHPTAAFYLPMARFWELMSGALLAYLTLQRDAAGSESERSSAAQRAPSQAGGAAQAWVAVRAWCGVALIVAALWLIDANSVFPGWWALLPVLGTVLLITSPTAWLNRVVLSNRVVVFIGLISYPLYLWHWALLAIMRTRLYEIGAEAPRAWRLGALALSFVLAWLTYELIEKPIRFGARKSFRPALVLLTMMACVGLAGLAVDRSDGVAVRYPAVIRPLAAYQYHAQRAQYDALLAANDCFIDPLRTGIVHVGTECVDQDDGIKKLVVLWGDSHAASLYAGLQALQNRSGDFRLAQFTMGACPPLLGQQLAEPVGCKSFNDAVFEKIRTLNADTVLLEADWWYYRAGAAHFADLIHLQETVQRLKASGVRRVVVFGNLPVWQIAQPKVAVKVWLDTHALPERTQAYFNEESRRADARVRAAVANSDAVFVSPISVLCDDSGCLLTTDRTQWTPLAFDSAHLTRAGSIYLVALVAAEIWDGGALPHAPVRQAGLSQR